MLKPYRLSQLRIHLAKSACLYFTLHKLPASQYRLLHFIQRTNGCFPITQLVHYNRKKRALLLRHLSH